MFDAVVAQAAELTPLPAELAAEGRARAQSRARWPSTARAGDPPAELFARLPPWAQTSYADLLGLVVAGG